MPIVSVVACEDYDMARVKAALNDVLKPLGGLDWVYAGMRVVIKANLVSMLKPERAATTHPALLCALTDMLIEKGALVTIGDSPGGLYNAAYVNAVYAGTGVRAAEAHGAKLNQDFAHKAIENPSGHTLKSLEYTSYIDDADAIINFCKLKTHGMMGMSGCVKNMFGVIPGVFKPEYHYRYPAHAAFANMLVDINERFPVKLCLVDAVTGMEGNGPTMGKPRHIGALLASDSPYACDEICARIIGIEPDALETLCAAKARGLLGDKQVYGDVDALRVSNFELVRARKETSFDKEFRGVVGRTVGFVIRNALSPIPAPRKKICVGCAKCEQICPAKAIHMENKIPKINRKQCIRCFCCQEFCPVGAMRVKRPIIARILNR